MLFARIIALIATALAVTAVAAQQAATAPASTRPATPTVPEGSGIIIETTVFRHAVDPATGERTRLQVEMPGDVVSPDGRHVAFIDAVREEGGAEAVLKVGDPEPVMRPAARRITTDAVAPESPRWLPDSRRLVYVQGKGPNRQVRLVDTGAQPPDERTITSGQRGSRQPRVTPDGRISYLKVRGRDGRRVLVDLVVRSPGDDEPKTLVSETDILDHAWSPDGGTVAYGTSEAIRFLDVESGETTSREFLGIDRRLYAHGATSMAWKPDGTAVAARITFLGGRASVPGKPAPTVYGDDEIFVVPIDGPAKVLPTFRDTRIVDWRP